MNGFCKVCVVFFVLLGSVMEAQQKTLKRAKKAKKTAINFEDQLIEGEVKKPELFYLLQKRQFNYKRLIQLRENFLPEMSRSAEDIATVESDR